MDFFEWLDTCHNVNRRVERGLKALPHISNKDLWISLLQILTFLFVSPICLFLYILGIIAEWRDNRRDGVKWVSEE